ISYSILNLPKILSRLTPILYFLALFYIIYKYENNNELKIFWFLGIKKIDFLKQIIQFSLLFSIILVFVNSIIVPLSLNKARQFIINSNIDFFPNLIKENKFIDTVDKLTIYIEKKEQDNFKNIFIKDEKNEVIKIIYSKNGMLKTNTNEKSLILNDGKIINIKDNRISEFNFNKTNFEFGDYLTKSTTDYKVQEKNSLELINCYYNFSILGNKTFYDPINCNEPAIKEIQSELYKRFLKPLFISIISIIVGYLILFSKENRIFKKFAFSVFVVGISLIIFSELLSSFSKINHSKLIFATLLPLITNTILYYIFKKLNFKT
ncbi:LptF/LptG family permease, partial [Candidatus Pelagibacter sp.]|nr:LptF/LptG family permease [Candidatus Pelagibacter sp.]